MFNPNPVQLPPHTTHIWAFITYVPAPAPSTAIVSSLVIRAQNARATISTTLAVIPFGPDEVPSLDGVTNLLARMGLSILELEVGRSDKHDVYYRIIETCTTIKPLSFHPDHVPRNVYHWLAIPQLDEPGKYMLISPKAINSQSAYPFARINFGEHQQRLAERLAQWLAILGYGIMAVGTQVTLRTDLTGAYEPPVLWVVAKSPETLA